MYDTLKKSNTSGTVLGEGVWLGDGVRDGVTVCVAVGVGELERLAVVLGVTDGDMLVVEEKETVGDGVPVSEAVAVTLAEGVLDGVADGAEQVADEPAPAKMLPAVQKHASEFALPVDTKFCEHEQVVGEPAAVEPVGHAVQASAVTLAAPFE